MMSKNTKLLLLSLGLIFIGIILLTSLTLFDVHSPLEDFSWTFIFAGGILLVHFYISENQHYND